MPNTPRDGISKEFKMPNSFEPKKIRRDGFVPEDQIVFFAFLSRQIEEGDFEKKWWPLLDGLPLNILYFSASQGQNKSPAVVSALYEPDLTTFRGTDTTRELTYFNKLGRNCRVRVVLKKAGGMETFKYKGEKLIASASGHDFASAMTQTTMIGIQENEPIQTTNL